MARRKRTRLLLALAVLAVLGLALWFYLANRPARPATPRVVLPIRTDTGWGAIDAATGAIIIPPTYPEPVAITPVTVMGWRKGDVSSAGIEDRHRYSPTLEELIKQPKSYPIFVFRRNQPQVSVLVAHKTRRWPGLRGSFPFVAYRSMPRSWAYTTAGDLIATGTGIYATRELLAIGGDTYPRLLRIADLRPVPPGAWSHGTDIVAYRNVFAEAENSLHPETFYDLDGQRLFGSKVTLMWQDMYKAEPGHSAIITGYPSPPSAATDHRANTQANARRKYGIPQLGPVRDRKKEGIEFIFWAEAPIPNATVYWQTPDGMRAVPGKPFDLAWKPDSGAIRAVRGNAVYELRPDQEPRQIGDLSEPTAWADPPADAMDGSGLFGRLAATDTQPERLITRSGGFLRQVDGSLRRIGPAAAPDERFICCYISPNRVHLLLDQDPDDQSREPLFHLDSYDLEGALVSRTALRERCIASTDSIEVCSDSHSLAMATTDLLLMHVDDPFALPFDALACLSEPTSPTLRLLIRRDGDLYVGDANGTRIHDLPDDVRCLAWTFNTFTAPYIPNPAGVASMESSWAVETPTETWLLDRDGRCMARLPYAMPPRDLPNLADNVLVARSDRAPFAVIGSLILQETKKGYRVFDSQLRDFTGRTWLQVVLINDDILMLVAADELRYIRLADASTIWSWKGTFFVPPPTAPGAIERFVDDITPAGSSNSFGDDDDDDDDDGR